MLPETRLGSRERQVALDTFAEHKVATMTRATTPEMLAKIRAEYRRTAAGILHLGGAIVNIEVGNPADSQMFWERAMAQPYSETVEPQGGSL